jgi:hypothetical protein
MCTADFLIGGSVNAPCAPHEPALPHKPTKIDAWQSSPYEIAGTDAPLFFGEALDNLDLSKHVVKHW